MGATYDVSITLSRRLRDGRLLSLASLGVDDLVLAAPRLALVLTEVRTGGGGVGPSDDNWSEWSSLLNSSKSRFRLVPLIGIASPCALIGEDGSKLVDGTNASG